jgi:hypothetical protein
VAVLVVRHHFILAVPEAEPAQSELQQYLAAMQEMVVQE